MWQPRHSAYGNSSETTTTTTKHVDTMSTTYDYGRKTRWQTKTYIENCHRNRTKCDDLIHGNAWCGPRYTLLNATMLDSMCDVWHESQMLYRCHSIYSHRRFVFFFFWRSSLLYGARDTCLLAEKKKQKKNFQNEICIEMFAFGKPTMVGCELRWLTCNCNFLLHIAQVGKYNRITCIAHLVLKKTFLAFE